MTRVLITGVRGKTGAPLAELLAARPGVDVLGGSSDPSSITIDGVRPTSFSWDDPSGWAAATDGVDAVYLVRPDRADAPDLVAALLAETPRDARIVLLSERDADSFAPGSWALRVEQAVRESGRAWTMLRPSWFMQVFTDPRYYRDEIAEHGRLPFAGGGATVAWIDARDIAAVAERALLDEAPRRAGLRALRAGGDHAAPHRRGALGRAGPAGQPRGDHDRGRRGRRCRRASSGTSSCGRSSASTTACSPASPTRSRR